MGIKRVSWEQGSFCRNGSLSCEQGYPCSQEREVTLVPKVTRVIRVSEAILSRLILNTFFSRANG